VVRLRRGAGAAHGEGEQIGRPKLLFEVKQKEEIMARKAKPIPKGFRTVTTHLVIHDATKAIEFYQDAFGAQLLAVHNTPDGKVMHAEIKIGDSVVMFADEFPGSPAASPQTLGRTTSVLHIYVENSDALFNRAVAAGASVLMPMMDMFWGDRYGQVKDPFGHMWAIATRKEIPTPAELEKRAAEAFSEMAKAAQQKS
jgi:PhnB protein